MAIDEASLAIETVRELMTDWMVAIGVGATIIGDKVTAPVGTEALEGRLRDVVKSLMVMGRTSAGSTAETEVTTTELGIPLAMELIWPTGAVTSMV